MPYFTFNARATYTAVTARQSRAFLRFEAESAQFARDAKRSAPQYFSGSSQKYVDEYRLIARSSG